MANKQRSTALYSHPFSKAYWRDAAAELKDTRMLVVTALMIALRVALKPLAIPVGPQMNIQTAMLATALGAMIYGPVIAIPAAMISDTVGFMLWPTGDYFLPFMLTEIASTMIYALCLYRAKPTPTRVMLSRFFICSLVNVVLQQLIYAWYYIFIGNPQSAMDAILGITTVSRLAKNLFFFPIESVVITLFLKVLIPVTSRMKLTYGGNTGMEFTKKQIIALVLLVVVGAGSAFGYLTYRYNTTSRTTEYTAEQCVEMNKAMHKALVEKTDDFDDTNALTVIEYAAQPFLGDRITYTVAVYEVKEDVTITETMWGYKKTPASKDENLTRVATATVVTDTDGKVLSFDIVHMK